MYIIKIVMLHDKKTNDLLFYWLSTIIFLVFLMIIVGGYTRLTDSGLSITKWELFTGILPPLSQSDWENYFNLYKKIPQYQIVNPLMTLQEFKIIFYWEYIHRILGRVIGLFFLLPLVYFQFIKKIPIKYLKLYYLVFFIIVLQGLIGWYMVTSGLVNDVTVSHYRLSLHLSLAFIIISILFWQILNLKENKNKLFFVLKKENIPYLFLFLLIFLQIVFGAFVSGLDAGKLYQTWPLMNYNYFPDDIIVKDILDLLNFESHSLVQFYHRNIAYFISIYIICLAYIIFKRDKKNLFKPIVYLLLILFVQIFLGILTLLSDLNIFIASFHQITSVILILTALNLYYSSIK